MTRQNSPTIVVAGAGIIGASIAYHLAQAGANVVIIEKGEPAQGTTANSFAWINASRGKEPPHYYQLNLLGIGAWRQLDQQLDGALQINWGGRVEWANDLSEAARLAQEVADHQANGYPLAVTHPQKLHELEPNAVVDGSNFATFTHVEGHADPVLVTTVLLEAAQQLGAELHTQCELLRLEIENDGLKAIHTSKGMFSAEKLIIACGNNSPHIAAMLGVDVPLQDSPGVLVHTQPQPELIKRVLLSPHGHMKQEPNGKIVIGSSFSGTEGTDNSQQAAQKQLDYAAQSVPPLGDVAIDRVTLGWRVLPQDELPIIGYINNKKDVYLAAMHSGITLGPLVGQLATLELLNSVEVELLKPYRLERFKSNE